MSFGSSLIENDGYRAVVFFLLPFSLVLGASFASDVAVVSGVLYAVTVGVIISVVSIA